MFETLLDYPKFSVRIQEADTARLPDVLRGITPMHLAGMQMNLARIWHRFRYASAKCQDGTQSTLEANLAQFDQAREAVKAQVRRGKAQAPSIQGRLGS